MKAADEAQVGSAVVLEDLPRAVMRDAQADRRALPGAESLVDRSRHLVDLFGKTPVALDGRPTRRGNLHEAEPAHPLRVGFEQPLDGAQSFHDPLRVVEAVDPDADSHVPQDPVRLPNPLAAGRDRRLSREPA